MRIALPIGLSASYGLSVDEEHAPKQPPEVNPDPRRTLTRRTVITGAAGIVALAAVGVGAFRLLQPAALGKLVPALIAAKPFYIAHRGGSADWPEMSMEAYRNSVARGVDALEMSLARTSDGVWFGLHDKTLDRTSGTRGFIASEHTWNEVRQHKITYPQTAGHGGRAQPYARVEELIDAFGGSHAIFIDPKEVPYTHYGELLTIMERHAEKPAQTFVAKSYCTGLAWAAAAHERGYMTWGYYYAANISAKPTLLSSTQEKWDLLGMDYGGSVEAWAAVKAFHKPVIGHVVPTRKAAQAALSKGADGLMVSGVVEVLG